MEHITDIESLIKTVNLAEMAYAIDKTAENKEKLDLARVAYREACKPAIVKVSSDEVLAEFNVIEDDFGCTWIVQIQTQKCFASETSLAWMCEISQGEISNIARQSEKCPNALRAIDLTGMARIKNPNSGKDVVAIPALVCSEVLYYYAFEARGHEKRSRAKGLCKAMLAAGAAAFIAKKAGFEFAMSQGRIADRIHDLESRLAKLEKQSLPGFDAQSKKNQYGESPQDAYFRRRENWSEMWRISRLWKRNNQG
jgi:hypothetical protein